MQLEGEPVDEEQTVSDPELLAEVTGRKSNFTYLVHHLISLFNFSLRSKLALKSVIYICNLNVLLYKKKLGIRS